MNRVRGASLLLMLAAGGFLAAFVARSHRIGASAPFAVEGMGRSPEALTLVASGIKPQRALVAYVLVGSQCGFCQRPETKKVLRDIRQQLLQLYASSFGSVKVVGVAIDADVSDGLEYLRTIGLSAFDEISVGGGWRNDAIARLVWRSHMAEAAIPAIIVVTDSIVETLNPMQLTYSADRVLIVVNGVKAMMRWDERGLPLNGTQSPMNSGASAQRRSHADSAARGAGGSE